MLSERYERREPLASGGMGKVWHGYDTVLDREVAIKQIHPDTAGTPENIVTFAKRFRREARVTARINHPGVPQVYDALLDADYEHLYLVMELVHGVSLRDYIDPDRPLPVPWAVAVAAQICTVLSHAHAIPVVHRDLKPDNILVATDGTVKVLDFGIAALLGTGVTRITAKDTILGTTECMAPEQVQAAMITPRADLYALGCVLHQLVSGVLVFSGDHLQLMGQHLHADPTPLRELRPDTPPELEELVLRLLAKNPEDRPPHAQEVYEALVPLLPLPGQDEERPLPSPDADAPDPTVPYRRPYAPRPRTEPRPVAPTLAYTSAGTRTPTPEPPEEVRQAIREAITRSDALLAEDRYGQAAEVMWSAIKPAAAAFGSENPRVLGLRSRRAAILFVGRGYRKALPEFDALADAYARISGPTSDDTLECRQQAAYCRVELGQTTDALAELRAVLEHISHQEGDATPGALRLRRDIGMLMLAEQRIDDALAVLKPLHDDLCVLEGPSSEMARQVASLLARIRLAGEGKL